jgi:hypothetical protein
MTRRVKSAQPPTAPPCWLCKQPIHVGHECRREHHNERLSRLVNMVYTVLKAHALSPADVVYVCEGAADRVRREAEAKKLAERKEKSK